MMSRPSGDECVLAVRSVRAIENLRSVLGTGNTIADDDVDDEEELLS